MNRAARIGSWLLALGPLVSQPPECLAQSVRLQGYVNDVYSQNRIGGAMMYTMVDKQRIKLTESDPKGTFRLDYPENSPVLIVEKTGYRTLVIPHTRQPDATGDLAFFVPLPLIPLDQQAMDKPYMQSQQQDFTLNTEKVSQQPVNRVFTIRDALTGQMIQRGTLCLQYTKVERKACFEITPAVPSPSVAFEEADIVSVVVESVGYQTYQGNLILDKMDGRSSSYEIKITPEITLLTMNVSNAPRQSQYLLVSTTGDTIAMHQGAEKSVYAYCTEGTYSLRVRTAQGVPLHREVVALSKGLNYRTLILSPSSQSIPARGLPASKTTPLVPVPGNVVPLADTARRITLYFIQSEYDLQPEACAQLDRLVLLLRNAPNQAIEIDGHSDNVGNPVRNETLSEYRARVVYRYLQERGIGAERMVWQGKGSSAPKASNDSEETRKANRRVEIQILPR